SLPHRWTRFVRCPIRRRRRTATFALGPLRKSNRGDQGGRFSFARRKFPTRHPRSRFESGGRIAPHSSDELVSLATIGRASADRVCGNEPPQHGGERAHQNRAGEPMDASRFIRRQSGRAIAFQSPAGKNNRLSVGIKCSPPFCCRIFICKQLRVINRNCASNRW